MSPFSVGVYIPHGTHQYGTHFQWTLGVPEGLFWQRLSSWVDSCDGAKVLLLPSFFTTPVIAFMASIALPVVGHPDPTSPGIEGLAFLTMVTNGALWAFAFLYCIALPYLALVVEATRLRSRAFGKGNLRVHQGQTLPVDWTGAVNKQALTPAIHASCGFLSDHGELPFIGPGSTRSASAV